MAWLKKILVMLGLMADTAAEMAPVFGVDAKKQAELEKARLAAAAAKKLADAAAEELARREAGR